MTVNGPRTNVGEKSDRHAIVNKFQSAEHFLHRFWGVFIKFTPSNLHFFKSTAKKMTIVSGVQEEEKKNMV